MRSSQLVQNLRRNAARLAVIGVIAGGTLFATGIGFSPSVTAAEGAPTSAVDPCWQPSGVCGHDETVTFCEKETVAETATCVVRTPIVKWQPSGSNVEA